MLTDIFYFHAPVLIPSGFRFAGLLIFGPESKSLGPGMKRYYIYRLLVDFDLSPTGTVSNDTIRFRANNTQDILYRILRSYHLRIIVPMTSYITICM